MGAMPNGQPELVVQGGNASYYNLPGKKTASGTMFDADALAGAMPADLVPKLGTVVTVEYYYHDNERMLKTSGLDSVHVRDGRSIRYWKNYW